MREVDQVLSVNELRVFQIYSKMIQHRQALLFRLIAAPLGSRSPLVALPLLR